MDHTQHSSPNPGRRAESHDGDVLTPHPEVVAGPHAASPAPSIRRPAQLPSRFDVPVSALAPLFRARLERIYLCRIAFDLDLNTRATARVLGGYYKTRRLVRVYVNDSELGRRPLEELFDTFLHEVAHHLEYTEPTSFSARRLRPGARTNAQPPVLEDPRRDQVPLGDLATSSRRGPRGLKTVGPGRRRG